MSFLSRPETRTQTIEESVFIISLAKLKNENLYFRNIIKIIIGIKI